MFLMYLSRQSAAYAYTVRAYEYSIRKEKAH